MTRKQLPPHLFFLLFSILGIVLGTSQISQVKNLLSKASYKSASVIVDTKGLLGPLARPWENLAQGGESRDFSLLPFSTSLSSIKPKYIRIDHLYDFYIQIIHKNGQLEYDFTNLDRLLNEFKTIGVKPFISLSYTPTVLNAEMTGVPNDWRIYQDIVKATIEHISGINGLAFKDVYYEVWNEPDLFGNWKTYGEKNYLTLYQMASQGAIQAQNVYPFKFGGPAITKLYPNWLNNLLAFIVQKNLRLDFFSWHHYSSNLDDFQTSINEARELLKGFPSKTLNIELIISEWGIDSATNPAYDNQISASHLVAAQSVFLNNISKAFSFEIQDGENPEGLKYWGRWGLYTSPRHNSQLKPRAKALQLLSRLGTTQLSLVGEGTYVSGIASTQANNTISLILSNYDPNNLHTETVPISLKRLTNGKYHVKKTYLNQSESSSEIDVDTTYTDNIPMPPNSVFLLEIQPI